MSVAATSAISYNPITGQHGPLFADLSEPSSLHSSRNTSTTTSPVHSRTTSTSSRQPSFSTPPDNSVISGRHERTPSMGWSAADVISAPHSQPAASQAPATPLTEDDTAPLERQDEILSHPPTIKPATAASASALPTTASPSSSAAASSGVSHARNTTFSSSFMRSNKLGMATLPLPTSSAASSNTSTPAISRSSTPVLRASPRVRSSTPRTGSTTVPRFALPTASVAAHRGELRAQTARTPTPSSTSAQRVRRKLTSDDGGGLEADDVSLLSSLHEVPGSTSELLSLLFPDDVTTRSKCDEVLRRENVDMTALLMLTQTHMRQMGLTVGMRVKLATAVYVMRKLKGLEVADRGLIDPNSRSTARRPAHPHTSNGPTAVSKPAHPIAAVRAEKADTTEQPSTVRHAAAIRQQRLTSPTKSRHTSPTKPHTSSTANPAAVVTLQRSQEIKERATSSTTAALKARFQALNHKYRDKEHDGSGREETVAAGGEEKEVSPRKTARRLLVERMEVVIDNEEEERKREDKRRLEEERKEKLRLDREKRKEEREQAKAEAAKKQAAEREEKEAERKRKEEEREQVVAAEREKRRAEAEKAKQEKHKVTPKLPDSKKEEELNTSATRQQSRASNNAADKRKDDNGNDKEHKDKEKKDGSTSDSSSVFRRSTTPIVLKRNKKADGSSGLAVAAVGTDEAKAAEGEVNSIEQLPLASAAPTTAPANLSKLSLPDIPLSYSSTASPTLPSSASSSSLSASTSSSSLPSTAASSATAAGEALAKAKARIQAAKSARESIKSTSTNPLTNRTATTTTTATTSNTNPIPATVDTTADNSNEQSTREQQHTEGSNGVVDSSGGSGAGGGGSVTGEHKRRVSHVGGLIDQFETVTTSRRSSDTK